MSVFYKNTRRVLSYDVLWQQKRGLCRIEWAVHYNQRRKSGKLF